MQIAPTTETPAQTESKEPTIEEIRAKAENQSPDVVVEEKITVTETVTSTGTGTPRQSRWWRRMFDGTRNRWRRSRKMVGPTESPAGQASSSEPIKQETSKTEETPKEETPKEEPPKEQKKEDTPKKEDAPKEEVPKEDSDEKKD